MKFVKLIAAIIYFRNVKDEDAINYLSVVGTPNGDQMPMKLRTGGKPAFFF